MTERQAKLQRCREQAAQYAARLERDRCMAAHPAGKGGAKPNADKIVKDPTGVRAVHGVDCLSPECRWCA